MYRIRGVGIDVAQLTHYCRASYPFGQARCFHRGYARRVTRIISLRHTLATFRKTHTRNRWLLRDLGSNTSYLMPVHSDCISHGIIESSANRALCHKFPRF